jgi:hypothetical protein
VKLFVDDIRPAPPGWVPVRTVGRAIRMLDTQHVTEVSLDHDIQCRHAGCYVDCEMESFEAVARFIAGMRFRPRVRIHTANVIAGRRMAEILGIEYDSKIFDPKDYAQISPSIEG